MIPGRTLHRLTTLIFTTKTLERLVEPAIADLQKEYLEAGDRSWYRQSRILLAGYLAVLKVIALASVTSTIISAEDRYALRRTFAAAAIAMIVVTTLMIVIPMAGSGEFAAIEIVALLGPQAVPLAIPLSLMLGIALGLGGRTVSGGTTEIVVVAAFACSMVSLGTMLWIMPASNETHHIRWALPWAPLILAMFSLSGTRHGAIRNRWMTVSTCVIYFTLLHAGEAIVQRGGAPPFVGPWIPNIIFVAWAGASLVNLRPLRGSS